MKTILISVGAVVVIGLLVLAYQLTGPTSSTTQTSPESSSTVQGTGLPVASSAVQNVAPETSPQVAAMSVADIGGGSIQTANFIADPETVQDPSNAGYYYLGYHTYAGTQDVTATVAPPYVITYLSATQYFNIALLQEPIGPVREEMQQYLMGHLDISQDQMCKLKYMVSVPDRVNSQYSGMNLGFSFCPGAVVLPK